MDPIETIDAIFDQLQQKLKTVTDKQTIEHSWNFARQSVKRVALYQQVIDYHTVEVDLDSLASHTPHDPMMFGSRK